MRGICYFSFAAFLGDRDQKFIEEKKCNDREPTNHKRTILRSQVRGQSFVTHAHECFFPGQIIQGSGDDCVAVLISTLQTNPFDTLILRIILSERILVTTRC